MIRVGVLGATGRMGRQVCQAIAEDGDVALVAAISPHRVGESIGAIIGHPEVDVRVSDVLDTALQAESDVLVDFTNPDAVMDNVRWAIDHAIHLVVGTTGIGPDELEEIGRLIEEDGAHVVVAPNFAIGAVLAQRFAEQAARFFAAVEIIELHHEGKADAPSGTALSTARRLAEARGSDWTGPDKESLQGVRGGDVDGVREHSVRLPGLVAHQEILFGGMGETLTIRHDSLDRSSFMPGVLVAIKAVLSRPGLTVGLEPLLDL
ncbi:MAG: 4-hydroxy-tetrahydrodipicolinate reductase [Actinobacteria bacterium]|nr:4-hydroxy-tetrahydrodipicolinate reductase [Actinomycetota bacterium]